MENDTQEATAKTKSGTTDEGCSVDWSWLVGRKLISAVNDLRTITFTFEDGLEFKVQTLLYKGEAFLAFQPYKNPAEQ